MRLDKTAPRERKTIYNTDQIVRARDTTTGEVYDGGLGNVFAAVSRTMRKGQPSRKWTIKTLEWIESDDQP